MKKIPKSIIVIAALVVCWSVWTYWLSDYLNYRKVINSPDIQDLYDYVADTTAKPKYYDEAMLAIDDKTFSQNNLGVDSYFYDMLDTTYLRKFPNGRHRKEAIDIIAGGRYKRIVEKNDTWLAAETLKKFPGSSFEKKLRDFIALKFNNADKVLKEKIASGTLHPDENFLAIFQTMKTELNCELPLVLSVDNKVQEWGMLDVSIQNKIAANRPYVEDTRAVLDAYADPNHQLNMIIDPQGTQEKTNLLPDLKQHPPVSLRDYINDSINRTLADSLALYFTTLLNAALGENVIKVVAHDYSESDKLQKKGALVILSRMVNSKQDGLPQVYYSKWEDFGGFFEGYSMGIGLTFTGCLFVPGKKDFMYYDAVNPSETINYNTKITNPYLPGLGDVYKSLAAKMVHKLGMSVL